MHRSILWFANSKKQQFDIGKQSMIISVETLIMCYEIEWQYSTASLSELISVHTVVSVSLFLISVITLSFNVAGKLVTIILYNTSHLWFAKINKEQ